jgi:flagellar motor switch protein FliN/FliY
MLLRDLLKLTAGSIIEFNRSQENPVEILVNKRVVARGSAIVVEGNYGVRIGEVASDAVPGGGRES